MDFVKAVESIHTKYELVAFIRAALDNFEADPSEWHNSDLASFLEAMAAWLDDSDGYYLNKKLIPPEMPEWKTFAEMIAAARIYE